MNVKQRILLVDDEIELMEIFAENLAEYGYQVTIAGGSSQAQDIIYQSNFNFDLVISDIRMPGLDGVEFMTQTQKTIPNLGFIFISGFSDYSEQDIIDKGAFAFLHKPVKSINLIEIVGEFFRVSAA